MGETLSMPTVWGLAILAVGSTFLGLIGLLEGSRQRRLMSWTVALSVLFVLGALAAVATGQPPSTWASALFVGTIPLLLSTLRAGHSLFFHMTASLLRRTYLQAGALLIAGPLLALGWTFHVERASMQTTPPIPGIHYFLYPPLTPAPYHACTDSGRMVPLWTAAFAEDLAPYLKEDDDQVGTKFPSKLLRTAPPSMETNCHGWVFSGGRYCIHNEDVEQILKENGYEVVSEALPGDVIIYRDAKGIIIHSGMVRTAIDDTILIESKWGILGRYLHAPEAQVYSPNWTYYRSSRAGNQLHLEPGVFAE